MNKKFEKVVREVYETVPIYIRNFEKLGINVEQILKRESEKRFLYWKEIKLFQKGSL